MNNKALFVLLAIAVFSCTAARLLSIREGKAPYRDRRQLALTIERCPDARTWLARHSRDGAITNDDYRDLAGWTVAREDAQAKDYLASDAPVTCHALRDWRAPS